MSVEANAKDAQVHRISSAHEHGQSSPLTYNDLMKQIFENAPFGPESPHTNNDDDVVDSDDDDSSIDHESVLSNVIPQMMFVSGETAEPSVETTGMIEQIVREQVVEMLTQATSLAARRGVRSISTNDLIFLIRHDKAKVSRLRTFLSWKEVRKNVKDSDDKGGGDAADVDFGDEATNPAEQKRGPAAGSSTKKAKLILPWEAQSFYSETPPERPEDEDELNSEEEEQNSATIQRLATADERTKHMTKEEYVFFSECRQASFTFRKGKRFREWAGFGVVTDGKPNDDVVDILGFLTFEIVQTLTEEALRVKAAEDIYNLKNSASTGGEGEGSKKRKREGSSLFQVTEEGKTPVEPRHVREAYRRLQRIPAKYMFMRKGYQGIKQQLRLI
ncbi:MAG: hypothetical protein Q9160_002173 [Pyrenula sp. 1 TL-2023]